MSSNNMMNEKLIFIENVNVNMMGEKKNILYNGLLANINVLITKDIDLCDYIFLDFRDFNKIKNYKSDYLKKLVVIDYRDDPNKVFNTKCLKYFKRSIVNKKNMKLINYNREIIPISYCLKQEVLQFKNLQDYLLTSSFPNENFCPSLMSEIIARMYRTF